MTLSIAILNPGSILYEVVAFLMEMVGKAPADGGVAERESLFREIVRANSDLIDRMSFTYTASRQEMEDLRQDILVNIWRGLPYFRKEAAMRTWIYRVALNTCVSTVRRRSREPKTLSLETYQLGIANDDSDEQYRKRIELLHGYISRLSAVDRAIVIMRLDGCDYEEIASTVGMNRNTIATRLRRLKQKIAVMAENE